MSEHDPVDQLAHFRGPLMTQPPAAEVRRRGDRIRRRNRGLAVAGGVVAVALVAAPLALLSRGEGASPPPATQTSQTPPPPSASAVDAAQGPIPDGFPLAAGLPATNGNDGSPVRVTDRPGVASVVLCGATAWSPAGHGDPIGLAGVTYTGEAEDARARTLAVYADAGTARTVMAAFRDNATDCPSDTQGGTEQVYALSEGSVGEESLVLTHRYRTPGVGFDTGLEVIQAVRVGNAVLLTSDYGEGGGSAASIDAAVAAAAHQVGETVDAMGRLGEGAAPPDTPGQTSSTTVGLGDIPADFPLDRAGTTVPGGDVHFVPPAADGPGFEAVRPCGEQIWTADPAGRMATRGQGPEYADIRELRVFTTADEAVAEVDALRARLAQCADEPVGGGGTLTHRVFDVSTGYDSVTWGDTYDTGTGGGVYQVVRVGRAVLATGQQGEWTPDSVASAVPAQTDLTRTLAASMCLFTDAGC